MIGWTNWALNMALLMCLALQSSYTKISGKSQRNQLIYINCQVTRDLSWFADMFEAWTGVHMLHARIWSPCDTTLSLYYDTSLIGLGFWCPAYCLAFTANIPVAVLHADIFWYKALMVLSALH